MQYIRVEPQQLTDCALRIENSEEDYRRLGNELYARVDALAEAWQGKDNIAFTTQIRSYEEDLQQIALIMRQYAEFLRNSARAYSETHEGLSEEARRLKA